MIIRWVFWCFVLKIFLLGNWDSIGKKKGEDKIYWIGMDIELELLVYIE